MGQTKPAANLQDTYNRSVNAYNQTTTPSATEAELTPYSQNLANTASQATAQNMADYGAISQGYQDFNANLGSPTKFGYQTVGAQNVSAERPAELTKAYSYLDEAMPGYRDFAATGGYSPTDVQELRARGIAPIRAAYGNTVRELDRSRALGGNGGSPNYIAAASRAQRDLPGQQADAETTVNANLADAIRQGKEFGLTGISGTGATMGGLSSQEAQRMLSAQMANQDANLKASMANQGADIQTQGMGEASRWSLANAQLQGLGGQTSLYGTTPAMAATFGNQALNAYGQRLGAEQGRNQTGLGLIGQQMQAASQQANQPSWGEKLLGMGSSAINQFGGGSGGSSSGAGSGTGGSNVNQGYGTGSGYGSDPYGTGYGYINGGGYTDMYGQYHEYISPSTNYGGYTDTPYYGGYDFGGGGY